ncbi:MAG: hypothetical protein V2I27_05600 [Erythrobacter sp.]|jgi:hypothetical protein|nr:hypothetical protein [Erythrobacter sp.]
MFVPTQPRTSAADKFIAGISALFLSGVLFAVAIVPANANAGILATGALA